MVESSCGESTFSRWQRLFGEYARGAPQGRSVGVVPERFRGIRGGGEGKSFLSWLCVYRAKAEVLGGVRNAFLALDKAGCKSFFGQEG